MYNQIDMKRQIIEANKKQYLDAIGRTDSTYIEKLTWLVDKWSQVGDNTASRIIKPFLWQYSAPFYQSIIADNIDYVQKHYSKEQVNSNACVALACLCGSQKVADFLLEKLNSNYLSPGYEYILGYVSSSTNDSWTQNIATIMSQAGKKMPSSVYGLAHDDSIVDIISDIFKNPETSNFRRTQLVSPKPTFPV